MIKYLFSLFILIATLVNTLVLISVYAINAFARQKKLADNLKDYLPVTYSLFFCSTQTIAVEPLESYFLGLLTCACAAARRAIGTRNGEQDT